MGIITMFPEYNLHISLKDDWLDVNNISSFRGVRSILLNLKWAKHIICFIHDSQ